MLDRPYERHVFVCTHGPWCRLDGAQEVRDTLKRGVKSAGLRDACRVNQSGCLNQCGHGPMVVVYPEGVWYDHVDVTRAQRILDEHIIANRPPADIRYHPNHAGNNKTARIRELDAKKHASD
ncbi:MAG: (2Fe-2S) ferredoxin domain-containing protein [Thermoplasmatota archaeon]